jgi:hypothetical protein
VAFDQTKFQAAIAERRRQRELAQQQQATPEFDEDLVPQAEDSDRSDADREIDQLVNRVDIIEAYTRWCGKMRPVIRGDQREGIMVSCPVPGHADKNPSAWINLDKGTWFCGACDRGGDKMDIAAMHFGIDDYTGSNFHRLRELIALDLGYTVQKVIGGSILVETDPEDEPDNPIPDQIAQVVALYEDEEEDEVPVPHLDWGPIVPENTFLWEYMNACRVDDVPEEFHLFHALVGLGFALGRDVTLFDSTPVYGNLFICTLGRSGTGKSKSRRHLDRLLRLALPYDRSILPSKGVLRVNAPGSAEHLIYQFQEPVMDPTDPKKPPAYYAPVRGLIDFNELSSLVARTKRMGSALQPTLMQFYDMDDVVETGSMTTGKKMAELPFASAITTTQPRSIRGLIDSSDDASGFLNRWIFVPGKEKPRFSVGGAMVDIMPAVKPLQDIQGWASSFKTTDQVQWSAEAFKVWDDFFRHTLEPTRKSATSDLLVRVDLTMKKLALLFSANRQEKILSEQSVRDAIYCWDYLRTSYGIPAAEISTEPLNNEIASALIDQIQKITARKGTPPTLSEINRNLAKRKYDIRRMEQVLETLSKMQIIKIDQNSKRGPGRPATRYEYVG